MVQINYQVVNMNGSHVHDICDLPVSALMASCMPGGLTATVSAFAVTTAVLSTTLT